MKTPQNLERRAFILNDTLKIEEFAQLLGAEIRTVYSWIHKKKIPVEVFPFGGRKLYALPRKGLIEWTEAQLDELDRERVKLLKVRQTLIEMVPPA